MATFFYKDCLQSKKTEKKKQMCKTLILPFHPLTCKALPFGSIADFGCLSESGRFQEVVIF